MPRGQLVAPLYQTIFSADPLLLSDQRQAEYGLAMLKHLLVYRPLTTSKPRVVDLQVPASPARTIAPTFTVTPNMSAAYFTSFQQRADVTNAGLTAGEIRTLREITMMSGASTQAHANNSYKNHHTIMSGLPSQSKRHFDDRLRIAAIGLRVRISKLQGQALLGEDLCFLQPSVEAAVVPPEQQLASQLGRTQAAPHSSVDRWHDAILSQVDKSLTRKSQVIVLPEFGLSPATGLRSAIEDELHRLSSQTAADNFIFGGTRHEGRYNRGPVIAKRHGKVSTTDHWHHKIASAKGLGENVVGPSGTEARSYQTGALIGSDEVLVAIAVCYDTYDPTTFLNLFLGAVRTFKGTIPRVILVPSFNPSRDFVELLRDLSFLARCAVIYVNGLHGDSRMFMCGFDVSDFADRRPALLQSISARKQDLQTEISRLHAKSAAGVTSSRDRQRLARMSDQLNVLQAFDRRLRTLGSRGDLDHIVTVEDCPACGSSMPHVDKLCYRDIQYYNMHPGLMAAIFDFRRAYFGRESFLPQPLRWNELEAAARAIDGP